MKSYFKEGTDLKIRYFKNGPNIIIKQISDDDVVIYEQDTNIANGFVVCENQNSKCVIQ